MIFWIALIIVSVFLVFATFFAFMAFKEEDVNFIGSAFSSLGIAGAMTAVLIMPTWWFHLNDLADVRESKHLVSVYSERIDSLESRLGSLDYPESAMWNKDSPVASIVEALSEAESNLAEAKALKEKAMISIEARASGPMSGIVTVVGRK